MHKHFYLVTLEKLTHKLYLDASRISVTGIVLLLFLLTNVRSQDHPGAGMVSIQFDDKTELRFYKDTFESDPVHVLKFFYDTAVYGYNIRSLAKHRVWLDPELLWLEYGRFLLRCEVASGDWYKVVVDKGAGTTLWLRHGESVGLIDWPMFLRSTSGVVRLRDHPQKIRATPSDSGKSIVYTGPDCFQVRRVQGDWIEIFTHELCAEEHPGIRNPLQSGWIRWRRGALLLIEYFLAG
jgi:hypothetical protein